MIATSASNDRYIEHNKNISRADRKNVAPSIPTAGLRAAIWSCLDSEFRGSITAQRMAGIDATPPSTRASAKVRNHY